MLIAHINEHWEKLPPKFPKKCLFDTLSVFQVTNEELLSSGKKEAVVEECIGITKVSYYLIIINFKYSNLMLLASILKKNSTELSGYTNTYFQTVSILHHMCH